MTQIDLQQAIHCFPALVELAASGEEVIIAKNNQPFIKLVSVKPAKNVAGLVAPKA
jgi:antitoxin (DNA-binding transcriptional repressor) of toxin-antitoxin stability system